MDTLIAFLYHPLSNLGAVLVLLVGLWRGAAPERALSGLLLCSIGVDKIYHFTMPDAVLAGPIDIGHMAIDMVILLDIVAVALFANRLYPLWMAALQLIAMLSYFYQLMPGLATREVFDVIEIGPFFIQIAILVLGLAWHEVRLRRWGGYPSWRVVDRLAT